MGAVSAGRYMELRFVLMAVAIFVAFVVIGRLEARVGRLEAKVEARVIRAEASREAVARGRTEVTK